MRFTSPKFYPTKPNFDSYLNSIWPPCSFLQVEYRGLTGPVQFREGRRTNFKFDLLKLKSHALVKVGEWTPRSGVNITDSVAFFDAGTMNVTLVVTTNLVSRVQEWYIFSYIRLACYVFSVSSLFCCLIVWILLHAFFCVIQRLANGYGASTTTTITRV